MVITNFGDYKFYWQILYLVVLPVVLTVSIEVYFQISPT